MTPHRSIKARVKRLDRIAGELNAWLLVVAIGLSVLDLAAMVALHLPMPRQTVDDVSAGSADDRIPSGAPRAGWGSLSGNAGG